MVEAVVTQLKEMNPTKQFDRVVKEQEKKNFSILTTEYSSFFH